MELYQSELRDPLQKVSRSFALCIDELTPPLRDDIALAYLTFRALDCVEDGYWDNPEIQKIYYEDFIHLEPKTSLHHWTQRHKPHLSNINEIQFFNDFPKIWSRLTDTCSPASQQLICHHTQNMARGMYYFTFTKQQKLNTLGDLNRYSFFVAGLIGELLTDLFSLHHKISAPPSKLRQAVHFGLFLQKINILKDFREDQAQGRQWTIHPHEVVTSLAVHAKQALAYLTWIPPQHRDYRLFCGFSLFLGLASLPYILSSLQGNNCRIPRERAGELFTHCKNIITNDQAVYDFFNLLSANQFSQTESLLNPKSTRKNLKIFHDLYRGRLGADDFESLELLQD